MLSFILTFFLVVLVLVALFMVLLVLMQRGSSQGGLGTAFGGGAAESAFGAETSNILTKATIGAAILFFVLSLGLYLGYVARTTGEESERAAGEDAITAAAEQAAAGEQEEASAGDEGTGTAEDGAVLPDTRVQGADEDASSSAQELFDRAREQAEQAVDEASGALTGDNADPDGGDGETPEEPAP